MIKEYTIENPIRSGRALLQAAALLIQATQAETLTDKEKPQPAFPRGRRKAQWKSEIRGRKPK